MSGVVFSAGYGIGTAGHWVWTFMELRDFSGRLARVLTWTPVVALALTSLYTLNRMTTWQNSIRMRMEMAPIDSAYPLTVLCVACATALGIILLIRLLLLVATKAVDAIDRYLPRRIAIVLGGSTFVILLMSFVNGVIIKSTLHAMDESFAAINWILDSNEVPPQDPRASGSSASLISWADIGRNGKRFVTDGPAKEEIEAVIGREAMQPIRVYAGFDTGDTLEERAQIALAEMVRVGGFDRSTLIIATSTGTGWLDPSAVDTVEFLHAGDIATVTLQYSYLPSWLTLIVEPEVSQLAANALFRAIFGHWTTLPHDQRPKLYLHGLSLGALGSEFSADLTSILTDPIHGALWSGPPFLSKLWNVVTRGRNPGSPQWRPVFHDSSAVRFMTQDGFADLGGAEWGPLRIVYLQHASDPMSFFSTDLAYVRPDWLGPDRGRDVSPYFRWFPVVSFFQTAFDIPMATSVPLGYGHNFSPGAYIQAWIEVTRPKNWSASDTENLKAHFIDFNPRPM
ncbi:membrane protein [Desulfoluna limicola]|uniref:Membrane protein n=1 Tax=Desulfoluna limicola TaxID=2810562 RepID=A0ABN6FAJ1_9BACT|nr:membrane protein [Desulfoluna limicola]